MSVNFSPTYGESPTGTRIPMNVDANGNLIVSATSVPAQSATATLTNINASTTGIALLAGNTGRKGAYFYNDSTAVLYLAFATAVSTTSYTVQIAAQGFFEMPLPVYTGAMFGVWSAANGAVRITELS